MSERRADLVMPAAGLPRLSLGVFPTPLQRVVGLVPDDTELWVQREDLAGGYVEAGGYVAPGQPEPPAPARAASGYGGNKLRRLELLLADPSAHPASGPAPILTIGGYGSHHVLATALYAQPRGHRVAAVLVPQPLTRWSRATLRALLASGATLHFARRLIEVPLLIRRARRELGSPRLEIPPGGSSPLGTLAWALGGREIAAAVQAGSCPRFDAVYAALGSGGMVAGLLLGLGSAASELVAVRAVRWPLTTGLRVRVLAAQSRARLGALQGAQPDPAGELLPATAPRLRIDGSQVGPGYGHPTAAALAAVERAAACGLKLEPTYTGRVLAALLADAAAGRLRGRRILLVHSASSVEPPSLNGDGGAAPPWLQARLDEA